MDDRALFTILRCAEKTDGQVGRSGMLKILMGRDSKKLSKLKFDHLEEYGSSSWMGRNVVLDHIDELIDRGCISVGSLIFFPMLQVTKAGKDRLQVLEKQLSHIQIPEEVKAELPGREEPIATGSETPGTLYMEKTFWFKFYDDLSRARDRVIILSAFVSVSERSIALYEAMQSLTIRGVNMMVYSRTVREHSRRNQADVMMERLRQAGVNVIQREKMQHKVAIIHDVIAWEGSLNILSHWGSGEHMRRFEDPAVVKEIIAQLDLEGYRGNRTEAAI